MINALGLYVLLMYGIAYYAGVVLFLGSLARVGALIAMAMASDLALFIAALPAAGS